MGFIFGIVVGAVFSPLLIQLFKIGYAAIKKNVDDLENK